MEYNEKQQKMINRMGTMMICYAVISLLMLIMRGWNIFDILLFGFNALLFVLFQFTTVDKKTIAIFSIILGISSFFLLSGLVIVFGLLLTIYGIMLLLKLKTTK